MNFGVQVFPMSNIYVYPKTSMVADSDSNYYDYLQYISVISHSVHTFQFNTAVEFVLFEQ